MNWKKLIITILRMAIGWHFFYEGISKIFTKDWTALGFLANSTGPFSGLFQWMASSEGLMKVIDPLNMYGLTLIGLGLFLGLAIRLSAIGGILLMMLYYFAHPPFGGSIAGYTQGSLYIVNTNLLEALVLLGLILSKEKGFGIEALWSPWLKRWKRARALHEPESKEETLTATDREDKNSRREALKNLATIPALGIVGLGAFRDTKQYGVDVMSGATIQVEKANLNELKGELPKGMIGPHEISRMIMGGNLIGGWAHSRDLLYVSELFRTYNNERKIFETLMLGEKAGINAINIGVPTKPVLQKYKKITGSKIKVLSQVTWGKDESTCLDDINLAIDTGMDIIQIIGNDTDSLTRDGKVHVVGRMIDHIRSQGYTAGLGAHAVRALQICKDEGIIPDYYMKTMHHDNYWSAHPKENRSYFDVMGGRSEDHDQWHDNLWCTYPEETIEFVNNSEVPVMGFKVLAAGAIKPEDGFRWALENGADFICVGMFDFQVVRNVNTAIDVLNNLNGRRRKWYGSN